VGFFLRVRPDAAKTITDATGGTSEEVELSDPDLPESHGFWPQGAVLHLLGEDAERLVATGLFERIDDSFAGVRLRDGRSPPPGVDLSNGRMLGIVEGALPMTLAAGRTKAERMLHRLAALFKTSGLEEAAFRERLGAEPRLAAYADAEFPELRFHISRADAISLIALDDPEPIYGSEEQLEADLARFLGGGGEAEG
jgi:hypothetical protein